MKPPVFAYERPDSIAGAIGLLARHGEEARLLAGGQSLMAALNMRLSHPAILIDITRIAALRGIGAGPAGLRLGALTRHVELETRPEIAAAAPLLRAAIPFVAHAAIRNRGTIGGSLALADPAAELPACVLALDARLVLEGPGGRRAVPATSFFRGLYETALAPDEVLTAIEIDPPAPGARHGFLELSRRHGDYAIAGLAATAIWRDGRLAAPRLAFFGVGATPVLATGAMAALDGTAGSEADCARAAEALSGELDPPEDLNASAAMRRHLARTLLKRVVRQMVPHAA